MAEHPWSVYMKQKVLPLLMFFCCCLLSILGKSILSTKWFKARIHLQTQYKKEIRNVKGNYIHGATP